METGIRRKRKLTTSEEIINYTFIDNAECPSLKDCPECVYLNNCKIEITERKLLEEERIEGYNRIKKPCKPQYSRSP